MIQTRGQWSQCPVELLEQILKLLSHDDLIKASGVCIDWYYTSNQIYNKIGKYIYRWPMDPPLHCSHLILVSYHKINILSSIPEIKSLELNFDHGTKISKIMLESCFKMWHNLKKIVISNVFLDRDGAKDILNTIPFGIKLEISILTTTCKAKNILVANREIFKSLSVTRNQKLEIWNNFKKINLKNFDSKLNILRINESCLNENTLIKVNKIDSLFLTDCFYLTLKFIETLDKLSLKRVSLDLRLSESESVSKLYRIKSLEKVKIITNFECLEALKQGVNFWPFLTEISVCHYSINTNINLSDYVYFFKLKNIIFKYKILNTVFKSYQENM